MAPTKDWDALARSGGLEKLKVGELKDYCKQHGLVQAGEKGTLIFRIKAHVEGKSLLVDGKNPATLKPAELKKACAVRGLSPMGYPDELLESLMTHLKSKGTGSGSSSASGGGKAGGGGGGGGGGEPGNAAIALANRILELSEEEKWAQILSLGGQEVTRSSPTTAMRKAYLSLSRIVHPDRLQNFPDATKTFQALVSAFERLSQPEDEEVKAQEEDRRSSGGKKAKAISRSNEGCYRTTVFCPRCKEEWGVPVQGLPPYTYNYMMMGLKTYCCATCLLEFGCVTATHRCPHCRRTFDYDPNDYHRHITCGNKGCTRPFGFMLFPVSERVEKEMREQLKIELEQRMKQRQAKLARLARSHKRRAGGEEDEDEEADRRLKERVFLQGLLDECPRCGEVMECAADDVEAHREHLRGCKDADKIQAHQKRQKIKKEEEKVAEGKRQQQEDLRSLRTWEFIGADDTKLWLLSEEQLRKQCRDSGLDVEGQAKDELVASLVQHRSSMKGRLITDGKQRGSSSRAATPKKTFTADSLPSNLHSMSLVELKAVCAAHGFFPRSKTPAGVIKEIEAELARDHDNVFLIEG